MSSLHNQAIGTWTRLGCLVASEGTNGKLIIPEEQLLFYLHLSNAKKDEIDNIFNALKNVNISISNDNGTITVIMTNWLKYQVDSTGYERLKKWRKSQMITVDDNGKKKSKKKNKDKDKDKDKDKKTMIHTPKKLYGDFIQLTEEEHLKLTERFGAENLAAFIAETNNVFHMKPKIKKDYINGNHYLLILNWHKRGYFGGAKEGSYCDS